MKRQSSSQKVGQPNDPTTILNPGPVLLVENTDQKWEKTDPIQTTFFWKYIPNTDHFLQKYRLLSNFSIPAYRPSCYIRNFPHSSDVVFMVNKLIKYIMNNNFFQYSLWNWQNHMYFGVFLKIAKKKKIMTRIWKYRLIPQKSPKYRPFTDQNVQKVCITDQSL